MPWYLFFIINLVFFYLPAFKLQTLSSFFLNNIIDVNINLFLIFFFFSFISLYFKVFFFAYIIFFLELYKLQIFISYSNIIYKLNLPTLINGFFSIHPIIIYWAYAFILLIAFFTIKNIWKKCYLDFFFFSAFGNFLNKIIFLVTYSLFVAMILGGWWAFQEVNWGGWWNWDAVELINLFYFFLSLLMFIFIRYNIIFSIHSFSLNSSTLSFFYLLSLFFIKAVPFRKKYILQYISFYSLYCTDKRCNNINI